MISFIVLVATLVSLSLQQTEIVVYPTNSTWLTILTTARSAGTTVTFRAGTYSTSGNMKLTLNGAIGNVIEKRK